MLPIGVELKLRKLLYSYPVPVIVLLYYNLSSAAASQSAMVNHETQLFFVTDGAKRSHRTEPYYRSARCGLGKTIPQRRFEKTSGDLPGHFAIQACMDKLGCLIHSDKQIGFAHAGADSLMSLCR